MEPSDDDFEDIRQPALEDQRPLARCSEPATGYKKPSIYSGKPALKVLTENDIVGYMKARFRLAEANVIYWPPQMCLMFNRYTSERNMPKLAICAIEMLLNVPLQANLRFGDAYLDLNDPAVYVPYRNKLFAEGTIFVRKMLADGFITIADVRPQARSLFANADE